MGPGLFRAPMGTVSNFPTPQKERASFAASNMPAPIRTMLNGSQAGILNMASVTKKNLKRQIARAPGHGARLGTQYNARPLAVKAFKAR
jgi:hypothetical protein